MPTAEARETQANLLYTPLRQEIENAIREHGAHSDEVNAVIHRTPLRQQTPVEVDTFLYALVHHAYGLSQNVRHAADELHYAVKDERTRFGGQPVWTLSTEEAFGKAKEIAEFDKTYIGTKAAEAVTKYRAAMDTKRLCLAVMEPLQTEYSRRPWTRAHLVTDGHVHSSTTCTTCFPTTMFTWLTSLSGHDEAEIVSLAGERACTVCYPSAPTLRDFEKASPLFTEEEAERAKARDQRATEKAERLAKKIAKGLTEDGSEFTVITEEGVHPDDYYIESRRGQHYTRREHFKTEQAAVQWVVANRASHYAHKRTDTIQAAEAEIITAIAQKRQRLDLPAKTVEEIQVEIEAKVAAKIKRDNRGY